MSPYRLKHNFSNKTQNGNRRYISEDLKSKSRKKKTTVILESTDSHQSILKIFQKTLISSPQHQEPPSLLNPVDLALIESIKIVPSWTSSPAVRSPKTCENFHSKGGGGGRDAAGSPASSAPFQFIFRPEFQKDRHRSPPASTIRRRSRGDQQSEPFLDGFAKRTLPDSAMG